MLSDDAAILILLFATFVLAGILAWLTLKNKNQAQATITKKKIKPVKGNTEKTKKDPQISIFEKYDYLGTKIFHNDGKYTVVEDNVSRNFNSINELPSKYRKMILEMETQNFSGRKDNYYMQSENGIYTIVFPDGTKKKYKSYNDIPDNIKKILTGN